MRDLLLPIVLISLVLAVPIVPFALFGDSLDARMQGWLDETMPPNRVAGLTVALLATDVFLPVPSSVVSTFAGERLGFLFGTAASWLGMTAGAAIALGLARWFGRPLALRFSTEATLGRIDELSRRHGPMVLILTRPVPVLAEASVLLLGTTDLPWQRFLVPVALANLYIAAAYSALGNWVHLPVALIISVAVPLLAAAVAKRLWPAKEVQ